MIQFENVCKVVAGQQVLTDVSFGVPTGELVVLAGPSGCGKTTTLKMINRLIAPTAGRVLIDGEDVANQEMLALRRRIGYVTQYEGLFNHMTVRGNLGVVPGLEHWSKTAMENRIARLSEIFNFPGGDFLDRYPYQLTRLEKQRVCIARAFAADPELVLMDDPFASLEPGERAMMQDELVTLQALQRKTMVFITSQMEEAVRIADRLCIMDRGRVLQYDRPEEILHSPRPGFVEEFVGRSRIFSHPQEITARDIMLTRPATTHPEAPMLKGMEKMRLSRVDSLLVVDEEGHFLGIVRAEHIRSCDNKGEAVKSVMREARAVARPDETLPQLLEKIRQFRVNAIPVVEKEKLVGLVTNSSIVTTISQQLMDLEEVELL